MASVKRSSCTFSPCAWPAMMTVHPVVQVVLAGAVSRDLETLVDFQYR
jgi:hypothetical protein